MTYDTVPPPSAGVRAAVLGEIDVRTVFQPIVSLIDEKVVGYEALSRWPGVGVSPERVFAYAEAIGMSNELDQRCIRAAMDASVAACFPPGSLLLINTEPIASGFAASGDGGSIDERDGSQVVFELTERNLRTHPQTVLAKIAALRAAGMRIAVDDVGPDPDVLAWLEVIDPDVIKLDLTLIQDRPCNEQARMLNAVYAHHERRGAVIVAEGIETDAHFERARAVGATLGQGYRFGHPAPGELLAVDGLGVAPLLSTRKVPLTGIDATTPFDVVGHHATSFRSARRDLMIAFFEDVVSHAECATDRPMVLGMALYADHVPFRVRNRYQRLAQSCSLVALFGHELRTDAGPGVVEVPVDAGDPLSREWTLIVLGSHTAYALIARQLDDPRRDDSTAPIFNDDREFAFVTTTDRTVIAAAAATLLSRMPRLTSPRPPKL